MTVPFTLDRPDVVHRVICDVLCDAFPGVDHAKLLCENRGAPADAWVRQIGMYLLTVRFEIGQKETARRFGRDRTTVLHASRRVDEAVSGNPTTAGLIQFLEAQIADRLHAIAAAGIEDEVMA